MLSHIIDKRCAVNKTNNSGVKTKSILIVLTIVLFLATACAGIKKDVVSEPAIKIIWPLPPNEPKIQFVRSITRPDDMGIKKGFFRKIWELVAGASEKQIIKPFGIAVDDSDVLYVTDTALLSVHVYDQEIGGCRVIGEPEHGRFASPVSVDTDKHGNIFISDSLQNRVYVFSKKGTYLRDIKSPDDEGAFLRPTGIAVNRQEGLLYIVDTIGCKINVYSTGGQYKFSFGERGEGDGQFNFPTSVVVAKSGELYVSDTMNFRVQVFDKNGTFISSFGKQGDGTGDLGNPRGIALDSDGNIYVVDTLFEAVQIFDRNGQLLLVFGKPGTREGEFILPSGIAIDSKDNIYISDSYNSRIQIFKYLKNNDNVTAREDD